MFSLVILSPIRYTNSERGEAMSKKRRQPGRYIKKAPKINWAQEIRIAFFTSILFLLFTTFSFWIAHRVSPGEFNGEKLEKYFANEIASELQIRPQEAKIEFDQEQEFFAQNSRSEDTMVICGSYQKDADCANGRFISVWERKDHGFWNELFGTKESYEIVFIRVCEDINAPKTLMCQNCSFQDVNSDEVEDIRIQYKTNFADRVSFAEIFLLHIDDSWFLSVPDLSEIETEIESQIDPDGFAFLDTFTFRDPADAKNTSTVYSLAMYGAVYDVDNPIWGGSDYLYLIAVNNGTSVFESNYCALVMMRFTNDGQMVPDPNWNRAGVYITSCDGLELASLVEEKWGYQTGSGMIFYGDDVS